MSIQAAYDILQECGWIPQGRTSTCGKTARQRFQRRDRFATVGARTVHFYRRGEPGTSVKTSDTDRIRELAMLTNDSEVG